MRRSCGYAFAIFCGVSVGTAHADDDGDRDSSVRHRNANTLWSDIAVTSRRHVAEEVVVLPDGVDVGGRMRLLIADGGIGPGPIKLTDVALFDATVQWSIASRVELDAAISMLAKQPSTIDERVAQGASLGATVALTKRTAIAASGTLHPLLGLRGVALENGLAVGHRHRLNEIVTFALGGGARSTWLRETEGERALIVEVTGHAAVFAREPAAIWGAWLGVGYSVPLVTRGQDPMSGMSIDPQPRLDLNIGSAVQVADHWDLAAELSVVDRGDLANPATRLPILDGGFDQVQVVVGVSRRLASKKVTTWAQRTRGM